MKPLRRLNKYFRRYKTYLAGGFVFVTLSNLFGIFPAQAVRDAFDMVGDMVNIYRLSSGLSRQQEVYELFATVLLYFAGLVLFFALIRGLFLFLMRQTLIVMSRHIEYDLKNEIFAQYQSLSLSFYRKNNTGDLMARISEDVSRVRMYVGPAIMYSINLFVTFILVIWVMLTVNVELTLYVLIPLPFLSLSIYYVNNIINRKSDAIQSKLSDLTTFVQESFSGIRVLKAFAAGDKMLHKFELESEEYKKKSLALARVDSLFFPLMLLLIGLSTLITIYVGGLKVIAGDITLGNIAEFVLYVNMLTWPVTSLGWVTSIIQRASASQQRINEFLEEVPDIRWEKGEPFSLEKGIEFKEVSFQYPGANHPSLQGLSFQIPKGKTLAIIGATGSGKSTIASLLMRLYDCSSGQILLDGRDLRTLNLSAFREKAAFVPQDVFLFSDSIYQNIAFGLSRSIPADELKQRVEAAARAAAVESNILSFPQGYNTEIGERGITLSGGQKQRISIARALVKQPEILVLDDCLSAVDTKTEAEILANFRQELKERTVLIISHRVSTVKEADHIIVLEQGQAAEQGSHEELMKKGGIYAQLYDKQLNEEGLNTNGNK